jgi:hypothetical protein
LSQSTTDTRRDWSWDSDGALEGRYVSTREVSVKNGPSAGQSKLVFDFHVGLDDELVSVWETTVVRSNFGRELSARGKADFEPGELMTITPTGEKEGKNGTYRDFSITYEFAAPKKSAAQLLAARSDDVEPNEHLWASEEEKDDSDAFLRGDAAA